MRKKIVLYLMSKRGLEVLKTIIKTNRAIVDFVVVGSDRNVQYDFAQDIIEVAKGAGLSVYPRGRAPSADIHNYVLAVSWRWMICHPAENLIVLHDSLLPKYRGFSPLVNMLINGEKRIGVSAIFGANGYDRGDLIVQRSSSIEYPISISQAIEVNIKNYISVAEEIVDRIANGDDLLGIPQNEEEASYSIWRGDDDYKIEWGGASVDIKRFIDAVGHPYMGAYTLTTAGDKIRVLKSEVVSDVHCELRHVGKVIFVDNGCPTVICGSGLLRITEAFLFEGRSFLPINSFRVKFI